MREKYQICTCVVCGEQDYAEYMPTIDNKKYCNICADRFEDNMMNKIIAEGKEV